MGALTILLAMLIVIVLAGAALKQYGIGGGATKAPPREPGDDVAGASAQEAVPAPRNALERARGVEATLQQQADDQSKRIDDATK
jgi:hypothetical protein